jgi:hypothetical protein
MLDQPLRRVRDSQTIPLPHIFVLDEFHVSRQLSSVEINGKQNSIRGLTMSEQSNVEFFLADFRGEVVRRKGTDYLPRLI